MTLEINLKKCVNLHGVKLMNYLVLFNALISRKYKFTQKYPSPKIVVSCFFIIQIKNAFVDGKFCSFLFSTVEFHGNCNFVQSFGKK